MTVKKNFGWPAPSHFESLETLPACHGPESGEPDAKPSFQGGLGGHAVDFKVKKLIEVLGSVADLSLQKFVKPPTAQS